MPVLNSLEATIISIKINSKQYTIVSAYQSPTKQFFSNNLKGLLKTSSFVIIVGDFIAKHTAWYSRTVNQKGKRLFEYITKNNLHALAPESHNHFPHYTKYKSNKHTNTNNPLNFN